MRPWQPPSWPSRSGPAGVKPQAARNQCDPETIGSPMKTFIALPLALLAGACATLPPLPRPAVDYRASGTEPFWGLTIDAANLTFTQPDAAPIQQPTPAVIHGFAGEIYQTPRI